jgi:hypothetical protein
VQRQVVFRVQRGSGMGAGRLRSGLCSVPIRSIVSRRSGTVRCVGLGTPLLKAAKEPGEKAFDQETCFKKGLSQMTLLRERGTGASCIDQWTERTFASCCGVNLAFV